ncbi:MAG: ATP-dependent DNA ligase [Clostridia bacterium]|nr:MAG: ATP-dependent DNA ligase [Clostridia bacterium]
MLAVPGSPFDSPEFIYEVKWDGYRCLAYLDRETRLQSRNLLDISARFPELADLHRTVTATPVVLDGEIIVLGEDGRPSFSRLQARGRLSEPRRTPAIYVAFDALFYQGQNICREPLLRRKERLEQAVPERENLIISRYVEEHGRDFFRACVQAGLEGTMAKEKGSLYLPGKRSPHWRKFRHTRQGDFVVVGYEPGRGKRLLGSLILAESRDGNLVYRGKVGTGFDRGEEEYLWQQLLNLAPSPPPFSAIPQEASRAIWVQARLVCTVRYLEMTPEGCLRHPVYAGLRPDKEPEECQSRSSPT